MMTLSAMTIWLYLRLSLYEKYLSAKSMSAAMTTVALAVWQRARDKCDFDEMNDIRVDIFHNLLPGSASSFVGA